MRCKFCEKEVQKLVDSHIIPRAFFEYSKSVGKYENMQSITNTNGIYPVSKSRIGWYDQNLVCQTCESLFGKYDLYAISLLLKNMTKHKQLIKDGEIVSWMIDNYSFKQLSLFFISLLWRAGASDMFQFKRIVLGRWLESAKKCLAEDSLDYANGVGFVLARFTDTLGNSFVADPHPEKKGGVFESINVYRFYLGAGYVVYIKVDRREFPDIFPIVSMIEGKPLIILSRNFMSGNEMDVFKKVINDADNNVQKYKTL